MLPQSHIFISYKSDERAAAIKLRDEIMSWGYETWLDIDRLLPVDQDKDESWRIEIDQALRTAMAVVAIVSAVSIRSRNVTSEWDIAITSNVPFFPLKHNLVELPPKYEKLNLIDFTEDDYLVGYESLRQRLALIGKDFGPSKELYSNYLKTLFASVSHILGERLIRGLSTYGKDGELIGEPLNLEIEITKSRKSDQIQEYVIGELQESWVNYHGRMILVGQAGAGKTTSLLNFVRDCIIRRLLDPNQPLPIFAEFKNCIGTLAPDHSEPIIQDWLTANFDADDKPSIIELILAGDTILFLDSLDELGNIWINPFSKYGSYLRILALLPKQNDIVITCRDHLYENIKNNIIDKFDYVGMVRPLSKVQIHQYLRFQKHLRELLDTDKKLFEVTQTPLLLSLFAFAYEKDVSQDQLTKFSELAHSGEIRDQVIQSYIERRYQHEIQRVKPDIDIEFEDLIKWLEYTGWIQVSVEKPKRLNEVYDELGLTKTKELEEEGPDRSIFDPISFYTLKEYPPDNFHETARVLHILVSEPNPDGSRRYKFIHRLLLEYFAYRQGLKLLKSYQASDRIRALLIFKEIALDSRVEGHLYNILTSDTDPTVRATALQNIRLTITDDRLIDAMIDSFADKNIDLRCECIEAMFALLEYISFQTDLVRSRCPEIIKILDIAINDNDEAIRQQMVDSVRFLERLLLKSDTPIDLKNLIVKILFQALLDKSPSIRETGASIIGHHYEHLKKPNLISGLIKLLNDRNEEVRDAAIRALGNLKAVAAIKPLTKAIWHSNWVITPNRYGEFWALRDIGIPSIPELIRLLRHRNEYIRLEAAKVLNEIDNEAVGNYTEELIDSLRTRGRIVFFFRASERFLLRVMGRNPDEVMYLGIWNDYDRSEKIMDIILDPYALYLHNRVDRSKIVEVLIKIGVKAITPLIEALNRRDHNICEYAVVALGQIGDSRAVEPLLKVLKKRPHKFTYWGAITALGKLGDPKAISTLVEIYTESSDMETIIRAAVSLDRLKWEFRDTRIAVFSLIAQEQWEQCISLGISAIEPLQELANSKLRDLRYDAARALREIEKL